MTEQIDWQMYERVAACIEVGAAGMDTSVTPNASLIGTISGVARQIDILIDARFEEGVERRIIFDAKLRKRRVDVKDVESFEGMMRDVRASRGVLICSAGWTEAAEARAAKLIEIRLMTVDEVDELDHAFVDRCPNCKAGSRKSKGLVFWDGQLPLICDGVFVIVHTGKCDRCRSFAFWCWDCGEKVVVPDRETHVCYCGRKWFIEMTDDEALFVVEVDGGEIPLDRRPRR